MIFMDDMGWRDLGCSGSTFYETPNIDSLCGEGMRFDRAYAACPVCSPSRASFLSGRYPARTGVTDWIDNSNKFHPLHGKVVEAPYLHHLPDDCHTIAQALHDGGYQTWHVGKWHLGLREYYPEHFGFDVNIGGCSWGHPRDGYFSPWHIETLPESPDGTYLTDRLTDEAIRLIENADERPFYLNMWEYAVHTPIQAKPRDIARFEAKAKKLGLDRVDPFVEGEDIPTLENRGKHVVRRTVQSDCAYAAMIWNLDENIGRLVEALEKKGVYENTLIVFSSDNGGLATAEGSPTCNAPASEGKGWMFEGGTRVPAFAVWKNVIRPGTRTDECIITPDFYPTFLEAAGLPPIPEQHCDGVSFLPVLRGEKGKERPLFWHYPHYGNQGGRPGGSILYKGYKLIEFFEDMHVELYDLARDIAEVNDVSREHPALVEEMKGMLHVWQKEVGAKFPEKNAGWVPVRR